LIQSGGKEIDGHGSGIARKGICWSDTGEPDLSDMHIDAGGGSSDFTGSTIMSLSSPHHNPFSFRAYAIDDKGRIGYGNVIKVPNYPPTSSDWITMVIQYEEQGVVKSGLMSDGYMSDVVSSDGTHAPVSHSFYKSGWCSLLKYMNYYEYGTYNLVNSLNQKIGTILVGNESGYITVKINLDSKSSVVKRTYMFYGTEQQLRTYGDCPDYTKFPYPDAMADQDSFKVKMPQLKFY
jgi:hypothetical protein